MNPDPRLSKVIEIYQFFFFGVLPPPLSGKKLVQMDLKVNPEFEASMPPPTRPGRRE